MDRGSIPLGSTIGVLFKLPSNWDGVKTEISDEGSFAITHVELRRPPNWAAFCFVWELRANASAKEASFNLRLGFSRLTAPPASVAWAADPADPMPSAP